MYEGILFTNPIDHIPTEVILIEKKLKINFYYFF